MLKNILSRFMLFSTLKKIILKSALHLLVNWEVVSPNSRQGQLESISIIPSFPCSYFVSQMWGWFGGRCNVFLTFYAIYNISRKIILAMQKILFFFRKTIISHLMFSSCFFLCWKY